MESEFNLLTWQKSPFSFFYSILWKIPNFLVNPLYILHITDWLKWKSIWFNAIFLTHYINNNDTLVQTSLVAQMVNNLPAMWETWVQSLGCKYPPEEGMATHSCSIFAWRIPRTEGPGRIQSMGSQRVGHNWATNSHFQESYRFVLKIACDDHIVSHQHMLVLFFHSKLIILCKKQPQSTSQEII